MIVDDKEELVKILESYFENSDLCFWSFKLRRGIEDDTYF